MTEEKENEEISAETGEEVAAIDDKAEEKQPVLKNEFIEEVQPVNNNESKSKTPQSTHIPGLPDELDEWIHPVIEQFNKDYVTHNDKPIKPIKVRSIRDLCDGFIIALLIKVCGLVVSFL